MSEVIAKLDDLGQPAWIAVMVIGFVLFWPIGLGILAYLIWSGRMGCGRRGNRSRWQQKMAQKWEEKLDRMGMRGAMFEPSGNAAFDEYREDTLRRLEDEQRAFRDFLERLRQAKDRAEFDEFMTERRNKPASEPNQDNGNSNPGAAGPTGPFGGTGGPMPSPQAG